MIHIRDTPARLAEQIALRIACATICAFLLALASIGCASPQYVQIREVPDSPLVERLQLTSKRGPQASARTMQLLRRFDLADAATDDPQRALTRLAELAANEPHPECYYAISEVAFLAAKRAEMRDEKAALDFYGASVANAYQFLFDPRVGFLRNPYDPQFRGACDLYNGALEAALRILARHDALSPGQVHQVEAAGHTWDVEVVARSSTWQAEDFEEFQFVSDFQVQGLTNQYRTFGLGVPLIAVRGAHPEKGPAERYVPPGLSLPVTAFLTVVPDAPGGVNAGDRHRCTLELHDTLNQTDVMVTGRRVPLESDLSTPLAYFLDRGQVQDYSMAGLLRPDKVAPLTGLYMAQPYEPNKIPVLMVHGLYSSPITWMEMFNDLRALPEIRAHYQFWFYMYPTGQPFWVSAAQLRQDLARLRSELDPYHRQPALDQMVLVGHSMGGLVSKMQTVYSRDDYWRLVSDEPFQQVKADAEVREKLAGAFFFAPNVSVRRLVTIGTPHRGSPLANDATRWLGRKLITLPQVMLVRQQQLFRDNPGYFHNPSLLDVMTSLDSLAPDSPILPVLLAAERPPTVKHHNILGVVEEEGYLARWSGVGIGDGVVTRESAELDNVDSQLIVNADHMTVHRHPLSVLEVRRILLEHLAELRSESAPPTPQVYSVRAGIVPHAPVAAPSR